MSKTKIKPELDTITKLKMDQVVEEAFRQTYHVATKKYASKAFLWGMVFGCPVGIAAVVAVLWLL